MKIQVHVINAFSIDGNGGNPAGVVFDADHLSNDQKQSIATAAGFPETAFVSSSSVADFKLDFFTPTKQIPHCGHATIATFSYLKSAGKIQGDHSSKETIDGCRNILFRNGIAYMEQRPPVFEEICDPEPVLRSLHISKDDLAPGLLPVIVNTGNSFLIVPVRDEEILSKVNYDREAVYHLSEKYGLIGYYLFTNTNHFDATTRMFAPFYGIDEESGTGMAAGPLAAYFWKYQGGGKHKFQIEQGRLMAPASRSLIHVELEFAHNTIIRLFAGGGSHISAGFEVEFS